MKRLFFVGAAVMTAALFPAKAAVCEGMNAPDSVYILPYTTRYDGGRSGMKYAWSADGKHWMRVLNGYKYVGSDFGPRKTMIAPRVIRGTDGLWHAVWQLSDTGQAFAHTASEDLAKWGRETFFMADDAEKYGYTAYMASESGGTERQIVLDGDTLKGYAQKIAYAEWERLVQYGEAHNWRARGYGDRTEQDTLRFTGLNSVKANIVVHPEQAKPISDRLIGVFFEDLSHAADGGLYAELVQNRDFEYSQQDGSKDKNWNSLYAWRMEGEGTLVSIAEENPIHANNPHYVVLCVNQPGAALVNEGFDGIPVKNGEKYDFSFFAKVLEGKGGTIQIQLKDKAGNVVAQSALAVSPGTWRKRSVTLTATADAAEATLVLVPQKSGTYALDMISLFPQKTFKGRKNGLRADLAQAIADLHPRFVRFPGGCLAHGDGIDNIYDWKGSVGPLEARRPMPNIWRYHQTRGLGYYEFFQFCEDLGAEPVPVVAAGVPCQNSGKSCRYSKDEVTSVGQQGGIPMEEMDEYVQDVLDLIEYANGDARTTKWGKMRAEAGHPKPFGLKYLGVGNEDMITDVFEERFTLIYQAVKERYPEITVIGTTGPFNEGTDYEEGWALATKLGVPMVDEHYYKSPGWFIHNQDYYDYYDRSKAKVYLGEYASRLSGGPNLESALSEALYLASVERNADVVEMTSYAPLLAKEGHINWNPDLIYFNNKEVKPTVGYYVQQLYGVHAGNEYLPSVTTLDIRRDEVQKRIGVSVVRDTKSGDVILKLINLLPVPVNAQVALPLLGDMSVEAVKSVLAGNPKDKQVRPVVSSMPVGKDFAYELPSYSFTVIRVPVASMNLK